MTTATDALPTELGGDYPRTWEMFIGQELAKKRLIIAASSARARNTRLPHILLSSGRPGIGKTSLALLTAREADVPSVQIISGKVKASEARVVLSGMGDRDVLIYDEIHLAVAGGKSNAEWLLHFLQDGVIMGPFGPEKMPNVTMIACTTDAGRLPETVLDRFRLKPQLEDYTDEEAARIAASLALRILPYPTPQPSEENCVTIARAASKNSRVMSAIIEQMFDLAFVDGSIIHEDGWDLTEVLELCGLTEDGLDVAARRYLVTLKRDFRGEPAGVSALQDRLQEPGGLQYIERILMEKGYIAKTKGGRVLTQPGLIRARQLETLEMAR